MGTGWMRDTVITLLVIAGVTGVAVVRENRARAGGAGHVAGRPRMVDVGADQCAACKEMAPILAELRRAYAGRATIEFIDMWKDPGAADPYDVRIMPTQIFYDRAGREVWRHEGFLSKAEIVAKLKELGGG